MAPLREQCPAAEMVSLVFSENARDVRCRVAGNVRAAAGSPCCGEYSRCPVWRGEKDRAWRNKRLRAEKRMMADDGRWVAP